MVSISFLGGCREIGRSAILVESKSGIKCVLDYGIRFDEEERLPYKTDLHNLKAVALTHSHIDHSGAVPFLYKTYNVPFLTNPVSMATIEVLIRDMIKISNFPYPFGFRELEKVKQNANFLNNKVRYKIKEDFFITFFNAGHIPGSVSILIEVDKKRILYSGDINTQRTNLINPANSSDIPELDMLIMESTYALKEHSDRDQLEEKFVEKVIDITENEGNVLVPAFGVARSQEALLILDKYNYSGKIFIDGLARKVSMIYLDYSDSLSNYKIYKNAIKKTQFIRRRRGRNIAKKSNGVIISPSGMLKGGAAIEYIQTILTDPSSAVYLVGYQIEGSPGRGLLENGVFEYKERLHKKHTINNIKIKATCEYDYFDFSSHADNPHLYSYIDNLKFNDTSKDIFCVHGDNKSTTKFASELVKKGYNSVAPEIGEVYKV